MLSAGIAVLVATPASAQPPPADLTPGTSPASTPPRPPSDGPFFLHASAGLNAYTYAGSTASSPSQDLTPSNHVMTFEQIGAGYWVHPNVRLQLTGMLGETLSGLKPGASTLTQISFFPWVVFTTHGFFAGTGPLFAPRAFGVDAFNYGIFNCAGYGLRLGEGWNLALAVQVPVMFEQRASLAITPAVVLGYRFGS